MRDTYSAQRRRERRAGLTGEREQHHSLMGLRARREDQPAVLLLCTRARAAIKHHHHAVYIGFSRSLFRSCCFLVFLVWAVFAAVRAGFVTLGFVDLKRQQEESGT